MAEPENKMYDLIDELNELYENGVPIFPGRMIVSANQLHRIISSFPSAISDEIQDARIILKKQEEILQDAKLRAERIILDSENERHKLLNESELNKAMEEHAEKFKQSVYEECQQLKVTAFNEAQEVRLNAQNGSIKMREDSQEYAQHILNNLEQILNNMYQDVKNNQLRLQEIRANDSMQKMNNG